MKIVAIIQARMGSMRLPGKVLEPIEGRTMLRHVVDRVASVKGCDAVCVATSEALGDDTIVEEAKRIGCLYYRGSEQDVLSRYLGAGEEFSADIIVRAPQIAPFSVVSSSGTC